MKTAAANVTSAFGESIPFYGIAIIASATAYELWSACENMKDMDGLLNEIDFTQDGIETNKVCGTETPSKEDLLVSLELTKSRYGEFQYNFGAFLQHQHRS